MRSRPTEPGRYAAARLAAAALAGLLASSCAVQRGADLPPLTDWEMRKAVLTGLDRWAFTGRIAVSAGDEGFNGRLQFEQFGERYDASVSGPLGVGTVRIEGDGDGVVFTDNDGEVTVLADPESYLRFRYGWTIPVASLRYWALGIPDPAAPADTEVNDGGLLERLEQGGWTVTVGDYRDGGGQPMPRRLAATSDDARVRLVIDRWTFY